jgi:hypothetical protein
LDHAGLVKKIKSLELPLVVCRSKSGGAHVFLFTKEPIAAARMQEYLKASAALLGEAGREIFRNKLRFWLTVATRETF